MTFAQQVLDYHFQTLRPDWVLPEDVELLFPFDQPDTRACMRSFYRKYLDDQRPRIFVIGINPGRFGAGVTGVQFTGPKMLREHCQIEHPFTSRPELSAAFIWQWIAAMGGPEVFFHDFYITSVCPLGFTRDGKNYNYYDSKALEKATRPHIIQHLNTQLAFGSRRDFALVLGEGKNYRYLQKLNQQQGWFEELIPLPHPRYVMQYKRRFLDDYLLRYVSASHRAMGR